MTTRQSNNGPLNDTAAVSTGNSPGTAQRKSNDLPMDDAARKSNSAPMSDAVAKTTNDGTMIEA
jgi:hypothetical protein